MAQTEDLMDIYRLAQKNDPRFKGALFQREASGEALKQAWSGLLPRVEFSFDYTDTTQKIKSSDNQVFAQGQTNFTTEEYSLALTQPVFRYDRFVRVGQAKAEIRQADAELDLARQELILRIAELYLTALAAQDQLAFARAEQAAVEAHHDLASGRFEMGLVPITDLHDAKARLATVRAKAVAAEHQLEDALQALREATGETPRALASLQTEISLNGPDPMDVEEWVKAALQQNLSLESRRQALEVARREVRRQRSAHLPTLDLIGRLNNEATDGTLFGGGSEVETTDYILRFNLPIFEGGTVNSRTRQAYSLYQKTSQELNQEIRAVIRQVRSSYLGVQSNISQAEAFKQSVLSQELAVNAKEEGFRSGLYTSLAVLDAERDLYLARQDYAQARYDYLLNSLRLKQAAGTLDGMDLVQVNNWFN